ncbi:MAG: TIGR02391 family protein [Methanotrichaceae archaeon]|nr:TIGR02391 family protein [Methanotrichaceae archaeon]
MIHEEIVKVSKDKFDDKHYADSVESAFKEINAKIKKIFTTITGTEADGADLMWKAFNDKSPVIILDDLSTESGRNVQMGYQHIFAGSIIGIRNPYAHANIKLEKEKAMHLLVLASHLMQMIDSATPGAVVPVAPKAKKAPGKNGSSKPNITVKIELGKWELRDKTKIPHQEVLVFSALNRGNEMTLDSYGILVKDNSTETEKDLRDIFSLGPAGYYKDEAGFSKEINNFDYPCEVSETKPCTVGKYMDGIIKLLAKDEYHGNVELIAYFKDIFGNIYKSKPYPINIDDWL